MFLNTLSYEKFCIFTEAFQRFSVSAFQRFSVSAFQRFSVSAFLLLSYLGASYGQTPFPAGPPVTIPCSGSSDYVIEVGVLLDESILYNPTFTEAEIRAIYSDIVGNAFAELGSTWFNSGPTLSPLPVFRIKSVEGIRESPSILQQNSNNTSYFTRSDGYNRNPFSADMEQYWTRNFSCTRIDYLVVFTPHMPVDGSNDNFSILSGFSKYNVIGLRSDRDPSLISLSLAHEFGHALGYNTHSDSFVGGGYNCPFVLNGCPTNTSQFNDLMCSGGVAAGFCNSFNNHAIEKITNNLKRYCQRGNILDGVEIFPTECASCKPYVDVESDRDLIFRECEDWVDITSKITVCNSCVANDFRIWFNSSGPLENIQFVSYPSNFTISGIRLKSIGEIAFAPNECKEFIVKGSYRMNRNIPNPASGLTSVFINPNPNQGDGAPVLYSYSIANPGIFNGLNSSTYPVNIDVNLSTIFSSPQTASGYGFTSFLSQGQSRNYLTINKTLTIDRDIELTNGGINFGPNGRIVVASGSKLTLSNNMALYACDKMWQGIEVEDGGFLVLDGVNFLDAAQAIYAHKGAIVSINSTNFKNCYASIVLAPNASSNQLGTVDLSTFNVMIQGGPLKPYTGGSLGAMNGIPTTPLGSSFVGVAAFDESNMVLNGVQVMGNKYGVYGKNLGASIFSSKFTDGQYGVFVDQNPSSSGILTVKDCSFTNLQTGVRSKSTATTILENAFSKVTWACDVNKPISRLEVQNNSIEATGLGVQVVDPSRITSGGISDNNITMVANGTAINVNGVSSPIAKFPNPVLIFNNAIELTGGSNNGIIAQSYPILATENDVISKAGSASGIQLLGSTASNLNCNNVSGTASFNFGISAWNAEQGSYNCNAVKNSYTGLSFNMGSLAEERVTTNTFQSNVTGLRLSASALIGKQTYKGNLWQSNATGAAHLSGVSQVVERSQFTVNSTTNPFHPGTIFTVNGVAQNLFFDNDDGNPPLGCAFSSVCDNNHELTGEGPHEAYDDFVVTEGYPDNQAESAVMQWTTDMNVYAAVKKGISAASGKEAWMAAKASSSIGEWYNFYETVDMYGFADSTSTAVKDNEAFLATFTAGIDAVASESFDWKGYKTTLESTMMKLQEDVDNSTPDRLEKLLSLRASIPAVNGDSPLHLQNEAAAWDAYFGVDLGEDISNFQQKMSYIAEQCPLVHGSAVFRARSVLSKGGIHTAPWDEEVCNTLGNRSAENTAIEKLSSAAFTLYPNPADQKVTISLDDVRSTISIIRVMDFTGKEVMKKVSYSMGSMVELNVQPLPKGVYILNLSTADGIQMSRKLVVQ